MRRIFYLAASLPEQASRALTAFRDHVVGDNGSLASETACQAALNYLDQHPEVVQWLDARFGVRADQAATRWYSICGPAQDVSNSAYGVPLLGVDAQLGVPIWSRGAFIGQHEAVPAGDSYTLGFRVFISSSTGYWFGNAYGPVYLYDEYLGLPGLQLHLPLPRGVWVWLWVVLDGAAGTVTVYDGDNNVLASSPYSQAIPAYTFGIGGDQASAGIAGGEWRILTLLRLRVAATAAQRAAIQAL